MTARILLIFTLGFGAPTERITWTAAADLAHRLDAMSLHGVHPSQAAHEWGRR